MLFLLNSLVFFDFLEFKLLNIYAKEVKKALFDLISEEGLTNSNHSKQESRDHTGYLAQELYNFLLHFVFFVWIEKVIVCVGEVCSPNRGENGHVKVVFLEQFLSYYLIDSLSVQSTRGKDA